MLLTKSLPVHPLDHQKGVVHAGQIPGLAEMLPAESFFGRQGGQEPLWDSLDVIAKIDACPHQPDNNALRNPGARNAYTL